MKPMKNLRPLTDYALNQQHAITLKGGCCDTDDDPGPLPPPRDDREKVASAKTSVTG